MIRALRRAQGVVNRLRWHVHYGAGPRVMSALRKRWILFSNPQADIHFAWPVHIGPGFSLHIPDGGTFLVGPYTEFRRGFRAEIGRGGRLVLGAHVRMTYDVLIQCSTTIEIGDYCGLGQSTFLADGFHRYRDIHQEILDQGYDFRPIRIERGAVALSKCTIVSDLGERAMVGANSVVTKPIPAYTLAAGVPARPIDYFGPEEEAPEWVAEGASEGSG